MAYDQYRKLLALDINQRQHLLYALVTYYISQKTPFKRGELSDYLDHYPELNRIFEILDTIGFNFSFKGHEQNELSITPFLFLASQSYHEHLSEKIAFLKVLGKHLHFGLDKVVLSLGEHFSAASLAFNQNNSEVYEALIAAGAKAVDNPPPPIPAEERVLADRVQCSRLDFAYNFASVENFRKVLLKGQAIDLKLAKEAQRHLYFTIIKGGVPAHAHFFGNRRHSLFHPEKVKILIQDPHTNIAVETMIHEGETTTLAHSKYPEVQKGDIIILSNPTILDQALGRCGGPWSPDIAEHCGELVKSIVIKEITERFVEVDRVLRSIMSSSNNAFPVSLSNIINECDSGTDLFGITPITDQFLCKIPLLPERNGTAPKPRSPQPGSLVPYASYASNPSALDEKMTAERVTVSLNLPGPISAYTGPTPVVPIVAAIPTTAPAPVLFMGLGVGAGAQAGPGAPNNPQPAYPFTPP